MNGLVEFFIANWAQRLGWTLVHFLWQGATIAALLWIALRVSSRRGPQVRYALACLALVLMAAAPVVTFFVLQPPAPSPDPPGEAAAVTYPEDDSLRKGTPLNVPPEFLDGTATLAQAKAWCKSLLDDAQEGEQQELVPGGEKVLVLFNPAHRGSGGRGLQLVFSRGPNGLRFLGELSGGWRAVPPDTHGRPRLVRYWRYGGGEGRAKLMVLKPAGFEPLAEVEASGDDSATEERKRVFRKLFKEPVSQTVLTSTFGQAAADSSSPLDEDAPPAAATATIEADSSRPAETAAPQPWSQRVIARLDPVMPWAVTVWFAGVAACSLWHLVGWLSVHRLRRAGVPLDSPNGQDERDGVAARAWLSAAERLTGVFRLRRPVRLLKLARRAAFDLAGPAVVGILRPVVLIPPAVITGLTPSQIEAILAHELAHIRRHDYVANLLQAAVETLLFYHPAVWWVSSRIRAEREHCCDDLAVEAIGNTHAYADALATLGEIALAGRAASPEGLGRKLARLLARLAPARRITPGALPPGANPPGAGRTLLARIRRLLGVPGGPPSRWTAALAGTLILTALAAGILLRCGVFSPAPGQAAAPTIDKEPPKTPGEPAATRGEIDRMPPPPIFSADGRHIAYIIRTDRGVRVVRDGKADEEFDEISDSWPVFSDDGGRLVYAARKGDQWFAVVDGKVEGPCTPEGVKCSPDGKHVWYTALVGDKRHFVVDGRRSPAYSRWAMGPFFTPDGSTHYAVYTDANSKAIMVTDGKVTGTYEGITLLDSCPSPCVDMLPAYCVKRGGYLFPVIFGKEQATCLGYPMKVFYSSDKKHFAYCGYDKGRRFMVVDGKRGEAFQGIRPGSFGFQDSGVAYYIGDMHSEEEYLVVGDKKVLKFCGSWSSWSNGAYRIRLDKLTDEEPVGRVFRYQIVYRGVVDEGVFHEIGKPVTSHDGKHWAYAARRWQAWYLVVDGKAQAKDVDKLTVTGFLADGRLVYHTVKDKAGTVFVGKKSAPCALPYNRLRLTKDSTHAIWLNKVDRKQVLMIDGAGGAEYPHVLHMSQAKISPSGRYAAHSVSVTHYPPWTTRRVLAEGERLIASVGLNGVTFGPDDFLAHVVRGPDGKYGVFVNERLIGRYDDVWNGAVFLSPEGKHYAFLATRGVRRMMVVNGIEGPPFERILTRNGGAYPPVMGPRSVTYFGMRKGKLYRMEQAWGKAAPPATVNLPLPSDAPTRRTPAKLATDMTELGAVGGEIVPSPSPVFSPDGKHVAHVVKTARGLRVIRDGKAEGEFDEIRSWPQFSKDGSRLVYTARKGDQWFAVVDGKVEGPCAAGQVDCSEDGRHVWYRTGAGDERYCVMDGRRSPAYSRLAIGPFFTPDGSSWYAVYTKANAKAILIVDGKAVGEYERIALMEPCRAGMVDRLPAYRVRRDDKWFPVILGEEQRAYRTTGRPVYSADGKHFAYIGSEDDKQFVVVDGKRGETFKSVMPKSVGFRDSGQVYYIAGAEKFYQKKFLIVGDKKVLEIYGAKLFPNGACVVSLDLPVRGDPGPDSYRGRVILRGMLDDHVFNEIGWPGGPVCTGDGKHWAYTARRKQTWYLVVDGKARAKDFDRMTVTGYLADGRLVYHAVKDTVGTVFVGEKSAPGAARPTARLTEDSTHAIWVNKVGQEHVLMIDGTPGPKFSTVITWKERMMISPSGRYASYNVYHAKREATALVSGRRLIAFAAYVRLAPGDRLAYSRIGPDGSRSVFVDERLIGRYDDVWDGTAFFSPDGRHYALLATKGARQMMIVDGVEGPEFERILTTNPFTYRDTIMDSTSMTYFAVRKGKLYRIEHPLGNGTPPSTSSTPR